MRRETTYWHKLELLQSASTTQDFLRGSYERKGLTDAELKSYDNTYPFLYYLEHGQTFYKQAASSPLSMKPILLYYGFVHLLKACILLVDPQYPGNTSVLAHGVSSRKRKKRQYLFFDDEVRVQKNGLYIHIAEQLFHVKHSEGEKYKMSDLFLLIPELDEAFLFLTGKRKYLYLEPSSSTPTFIIPNSAADAYHMNLHRLQQYLSSKQTGEQHSWIESADGETLCIDTSGAAQLPFRHHFIENKYCLPSTLHKDNMLPDILIHYLLLYNLSMISRYETEWWYELMKTAPNQDYPFITRFLGIHQEKAPYLIWTCMQQQTPAFP